MTQKKSFFEKEFNSFKKHPVSIPPLSPAVDVMLVGIYCVGHRKEMRSGLKRDKKLYDLI